MRDGWWDVLRWPGRQPVRGTAVTVELDAVIEMLAIAIEFRADDTGEHVRRVTRLAMALAQEVAPELAADPELHYGFLLHDIGNVGTPDIIFLKPGGLTGAETCAIEQHPLLGAEFLTTIRLLGGVARDVIAFHHERWDGNGYPWGLKGDKIPLAARVFAVADAFDAMTSARTYRRGLPKELALRSLREQAGSQLDPTLVERFQHIVDVVDLPPGGDRRHLTIAA